MKYFISFVLVLFASRFSFGQKIRNLVVNGGFELFSNGYCIKTANNSVSEYSGWFDIGVQGITANGSLGRTSPDSYNFDTCGTHEAWNNHVPLNYAGYQYPKKGNGYIGLLIHSGREYPTGSLLNPLIPGRTYCAEMFLSVAETYSTHGIKNIQMMLHTDSVLLVRPWSPLPGGITELMRAYYDTIKPITFFSDFITDTLGWTKVSTHFVADSAYRFFTIGNFKQVDKFDTVALKPLGQFSGTITYLFLDDVAIYDCSDTIPPPEPTYSFEVKAYPNPASEWFSLEYTLPQASKVRVHITDIFGKIVMPRTELQGQKGVNTFAIDATTWAMGQYHISVLYEGNGRSEFKHLKMQVVR